MNNFITEVDILDEAKECFLTYAEEVLTDRAIPAAEDGLLSSQRKILWTMEDHLSMTNKSKTKKCNAIVGSTLATSYFHGDASCYGVLCKMSQKYLMRYPLIHGQGALGTQEDNDLVASSRYTEAKPGIYADLMMLDYKKKPVPTKETYNGEYMEPVVLPSLFPNALCNGRQAIGISMSHSSPSHNLSEVCDAICAYINNPQLTIDDIMQYIKGPDFPLGGTIINQKDIKIALATGKSHTSLKVRGDYEIEGNKIIFTTIPYRTYRNKIKEQLEKNIEEFENVLEDFNDESNIGNNRLVFFSKPGCTHTLLNKLFKYTDLQTTISYNMNYIVNGTPKLCSIKDLLEAYVTHQHNVMINIASVDLEKAKSKEHCLQGLLIALNDIDNAINIIKNSLDKTEARKNLMTHFQISEDQANAILDMKLSKLTKLDKDELLKQIEELQLIIADCKLTLTDINHRNKKLLTKVSDLKKEYGDERRTKIIQIEETTKEEKEIANVTPEDVVVCISSKGYAKRIPKTSFRTQKRGGKGVKVQEDNTKWVFKTNTIDTLMVFTSKCKAYNVLVNDLPVGTNTAKGTHLNTLINLEADEEIMAVSNLYRNTEAKYVVFITKQGIVKKVNLDEFASKRKNGIIAITLKEGDTLTKVTFANEEDLIITTNKAQSLRFSLKDLGASSRIAKGVKGINLGNDDYVIDALPIKHDSDYLATFTANGMCKKTPLKEFPIQSKGGKGLISHKNANLVGTLLVDDDDEILIIGSHKSLCILAKDIPPAGRNTQGVNAIEGDIVSVSKI